MKYVKNKTVYLDVCECMERQRQGGDITSVFRNVNYLFFT